MSPGAAELDLERALVALASLVDFPSGVDVAPAVRSRLEATPEGRGSVVIRLRRRVEGVAARRRVFRPAWQGVAAAAAVAVLVFGAVVGFSPTARRAVADFLGLRGVKIEVVTSPSPGQSPLPLGAGLSLGQRMTLADAQAQVPFRILVPTGPGLGQPDEVYLTTAVSGEPQVFLLYRARAGIPRAVSTGTGLLISEFQARVDEELLYKKVLEPGTNVEPADVNGSAGFWISGRPHAVLVLDRDGNVVEDSVRLAGNVLLWQRGAVTLRLEAAVTKEEAIRIAESIG